MERKKNGAREKRKKTCQAMEHSELKFICETLKLLREKGIIKLKKEKNYKKLKLQLYVNDNKGK